MSDETNASSTLARSPSFLRATVIEDESACRFTDKTMTSSIIKLAVVGVKDGIVLRGENSRLIRAAGAMVELIAPLLTGIVITLRPFRCCLSSGGAN